MAIAAGTGYSVGSPGTAQTTIANTTVPTLQITAGPRVAGGSVTLTVTANQAPLQNTQVALSLRGNAVPAPTTWSRTRWWCSPRADEHHGDPHHAHPTTGSQAQHVHRGRRSRPTRRIHRRAPGSAVITISGSTAAAHCHPDARPPPTCRRESPTPVTIGLSQALSTSLTIDLSYGGTATPGRRLHRARRAP